MDATALGAQFSLQLGFGVLLALLFVPRAPVGVFFYRMMGLTALIPVLFAIWVAYQGDSGRAPLFAALLVPLAAPFFLRQPRGRVWWGAMAVALAGCSVSLWLGFWGQYQALQSGAELGQMFQSTGRLTVSPLASSPMAVSLATLSALGTGAVAGSVGLAMVLGHWYLTVPKLEVSHLKRLNRVCVVSMVASLCIVLLVLALYREPLGQARLFAPFGLFHLGTRAGVGLLLPLLFAWMTGDSLRFGNTRSATGILYASTVLVLIGCAVSVSLQSTYGIPL